MDASTRAVLSAAAAVGLAVAAYADERALAVVVAVYVVALAIGWPTLVGIPARAGARVVIGLVGLGAIGAVWATQGEPFLREISVVLALGVLLAFVHELIRTDGRRRMVESVSGVVTGVLVAVSAAGWVAAERTTGGTPLVVVGAVALAVGTATSVVPLSPWLGFVVAAGTSGAVGAGLAVALPGMTPGAGALIGIAVGVLGATLRELFAHIPNLSLRWAAIAAIVLPVTVTGTLVYVVGRVLVG